MRARARGPAGCAAVLLAVVLAAGAAPPKSNVGSPPVNAEQLQQLRGRIDKLQADLAAAEKSSGEANDLLRESGRAVSDAQRELFGLAQDRKALEAKLAEISNREAQVRAGAAREEALAARLLRLQYQQGAPDRMRLLLEGQDAATLSRQLAYYEYIQRARAGVITRLRAKGEEMAALQKDAVEQRDELARNEGAQAEETRRLEKERAARAAVVTRLAGEIARGRAEIGRLRRDEARLAKLVEEIARALAARKAVPPKPPAGSKPGTKKGEAVEEVADASSSAQAFDALKGKMRLPVRGELGSRFGATREEPGSTWKGLFIKAPVGEAVHAVADGMVVYADWLRGFGNLLILDHGKGYMSLYAYNDGLLRQVGDRVRAGDSLASVGSSGSMPDSGLYFELRRDGKPFDPMPWVQH